MDRPAARKALPGIAALFTLMLQALYPAAATSVQTSHDSVPLGHTTDNLPIVAPAHLDQSSNLMGSDSVLTSANAVDLAPSKSPPNLELSPIPIVEAPQQDILSPMPEQTVSAPSAEKATPPAAKKTPQAKSKATSLNGMGVLLAADELGEAAGSVFDAGTTKKGRSSVLDSISIYERDIRRTPLLSAEEELALAARIQAGDEAALDYFMQANLRLVVTVAKSLARGNDDLLIELIGEGNIKLRELVKKFRPEEYNNGRFSSLAQLSLHRFILRVRENWYRQKHFSPKQLARAHSGRTLKVIHRHADLDDRQEDGPSLGAMLPDENPGPAESASKSENTRLLGEYLADLRRLMPRTAEVLDLHYVQALDFKQIIAQMDGITKQRIQQINAWGLAYLQRRFAGEYKVLSEEVKAEQGSDSDRLIPARERKLLLDALDRAYTGTTSRIQALRDKDDAQDREQAELLANLRARLPEITFIVNHSHPDTKVFLGWSAEDDPEYIYPNRQFYPRGNIKVNLSEKFLQFLDVTDRMLRGDIGQGRYKNNLLLAQAASDFSIKLITHETLHAWQYHTNPVFDYLAYWYKQPKALRSDPKKSRNILEAMLQDKVKVQGQEVDILADTRAKIEYEHDAFGLERLYGDKKAYLALADAIEQTARENPNDFKPGGRYALIAPGLPNSMVDRYLRKEAEYLDKGRDFTHEATIIYEGQYKPMEALRELRRLNEALGNNELSAADAKRKFTKLNRIWRTYMKSDFSDNLKESVPYLRVAEKVYQEAVARYEELVARRTPSPS